VRLTVPAHERSTGVWVGGAGCCQQGVQSGMAHKGTDQLCRAAIAAAVALYDNFGYASRQAQWLLCD
jgi:hypothetical protein